MTASTQLRARIEAARARANDTHFSIDDTWEDHRRKHRNLETAARSDVPALADTASALLDALGAVEEIAARKVQDGSDGLPIGSHSQAATHLLYELRRIRNIAHEALAAQASEEGTS